MLLKHRDDRGDKPFIGKPVDTRLYFTTEVDLAAGIERAQLLECHRMTACAIPDGCSLDLCKRHVGNGAGHIRGGVERRIRSEEHTSELQSLMRISYAVFCLKKKTKKEN